MRYLYIAIGLALASCTDSENGTSLRYIKASTIKPENCQDLGTVTGATIKEVSRTEAYKKSLTDIRRSTKSLGGNYLYLKRVSADSKFLSGIAYHCNN